MKNKIYRNVLIDLDDTLLDTRKNSKNAITEVFYDYKFYNYFKDFSEFYEKYYSTNLQLWADYRNGLINKQTLIIERFRQVLEPNINTTEKFILDLNHDFLERTTLQKNLIPFTKDLLNYLKPKYSLHIISNGFKEVQYKKIKNNGLLPYFDKIILSDEIGYNKPANGFFEKAIELINTKKEDCIVIGDSIDADIKGAYDFGIDSIWLNQENLNITKDVQPNYIVESLNQIKDIL